MFVPFSISCVDDPRTTFHFLGLVPRLSLSISPIPPSTASDVSANLVVRLSSKMSTPASDAKTGTLSWMLAA